jgi:MFS family permease
MQHDENFTLQSPPRSPSTPEEEGQSSMNSNVDPTAIEAKREAPVTWTSLPKKDQLAVLTIARLSEPLAERSFSAYLYYQLRSFDPSLSDKTISGQGGMLTASFAAAQFVTAVWWGRAADSPRIGRKRVILIGLLGTTISSIGVGFSTSFAQALFFRICAGCLNGNVGVMRTMISEIIKEKK